MKDRKNKAWGTALDERQLKGTWQLDAMHAPKTDPGFGDEITQRQLAKLKHELCNR